MNRIKNILIRLLPIMVILFAWVACKDDEMEELNLSRQFKPGVFTLVSGETSATISWTASLFTEPGEVEYVVELSRSINFPNIEVSVTTIETSVTFSDNDIEALVEYYARVKAVGKNKTSDSNWLRSEAFRITGEIFILPIQEFNILSDAAVINWLADKNIAKIILTPLGGGIPVEVTVTEAEDAAGEKLVEGLVAGTTYMAEIFNSNNVTKGSIVFRTKPSYDGLSVIDLRSITGRPKVLIDTLPLIPDGSIVLLKRGEIYTMDNTDNSELRTLTKSVTITSGDDFIPELATIHTTTNFNLLANGIIDSLVFRDINYIGVRPGGASFDNDYLFNINVIANVGRIRLDNCRVSTIRGLVRLQTGGAGTKIDNLIINNCVINRVREYGLLATNNSNAVANIRVTNSTVYNARRIIDHRSPGSNSIFIDNTTFNATPSGGAAEPPTGAPNYIIDLDVHNSVEPITINNCIFGSTWNETGAGVLARGIRVGGTTNVVVNNSFSLSDFTVTEATFIQGVNAYSGSSVSVFSDPANGNFTLIDNGYPGRNSTGDPRWR